ncbi:hypothetical protein LJC19_03045 [Oxalobacter sp. OttesenSCG-928-P03]|nr:hypothetical protein [Oxalobacter sp. OttesenSCG-928-P03]
MKQHPSARNLSVHHFVAGVLCLFACLLLLPKTAFSQEPAHYKFALTNKSDTRVTKIVLAPYGLIQIHTDTSLVPGEKIVISRPECKQMKMEITHSKGSFSFPVMDFAHEKNTALSLMVRKDTVPVLKFDERKRGDITGNNSDWRFTQVLGSVPFGVGVTTMAEAISIGAKTDKKKNELETTLLWGHRNWNLTLTFTGDTDNSRLARMEMVAKGAHGKTPTAVHESLMSNGYVYYSMVLGKTPKELYVTVPLARALERASMNGRSLAAVLAAHSQEVVVQSFPGKGFWVVTMTLAPYLVKGQ